MAFKGKTPVVLSASVFVATAALLVGSMLPAQAREIDTTITSVSQLTDVSENHWAYEALKELVNKYDVIEGYPNNTFQGNKPPTRYEMAAALRDLIRLIGEDMAALSADKADLDTVTQLQEEFASELAALKARTDSLEARAAAIEAKNDVQDERLTMLEKTQIHGDFTVGALANINDYSRNYASATNDQQNTIQSIARVRLALDVPVYEGNEDGYLGEGTVHTRLIAAVGNNGGVGSAPGFSGFSRAAADTSAFNEGGSSIGLGNNTNVLGAGANTNTRLNTYVERLYYTQDIKPGVPVLTDLGLGDGTEAWEATGQAFAGIVPFRDYFDKSKYRGDELTQFQNTSLTNIPGLPMNANMTGFGYKMNQGLGEYGDFQFIGGFFAPVANDILNTYTVNYEARYSYMLPVWEELAGSFYVGGFHNLNSGDTADLSTQISVLGSTNRLGTATGVINDQTNNGVYAGLDQEIWNGIGTNLGYFYNAGNTNAGALNTLNSNNGFGFANSVLNTSSPFITTTPKQAFSAVLHIPTESVLPGLHDGDHFGVGYAAIDFVDVAASATQGDQDRFEQVMEAYYTYYLNDQVSVVPSFQLNSNRLGLQDNGIGVAFGLRTNVEF